jgi:hypothetical protein
MPQPPHEPEWLRSLLNRITDTGGQQVAGLMSNLSVRYRYRAEWPDNAEQFTDFLDLLGQYGIQYDLQCERGQPTILLFFKEP